MKNLFILTLLSLSLVCLTSAKTQLLTADCPRGSVALCDSRWNVEYERYLYDLGYEYPWSTATPAELRTEARRAADQVFNDCLKQRGCQLPTVR